MEGTKQKQLKGGKTKEKQKAVAVWVSHQSLEEIPDPEFGLLKGIGLGSELKGKMNMKKIMIAAGAALCATVGFGEIASANVVGYSEVGLRSGNKGAGACFQPVTGGNTINLQDIKVVGYEESSEEEVSAMILDEYGRSNVAQTYYWIDVADGDDVLYGWFNSDGDLAEGVTMLLGEGLYFNAPSSAYSLQSAGTVPSTSDIPVPLRAGNKHIINPTPIVIDINDPNVGVWISGYEESSEEEVSAMVLDEYGRSNVAQTYYWIDVADGDDVLYGWFNSDGDLAEGVTLAPGEGLYVNAPSSAFYVNFPKVDL